jgi:hypothetical protein
MSVWALRNVVGMLVSLIGGGSGGWASVLSWFILLAAGVAGFHTTEQFMGGGGGVRLTGAVLSFLGSFFNTLF